MARTVDIEQAAALLHGGGLLAYPTEAVWGLGCDPDNEAAVLRLLQLKQRPLDKGLILVASSLDPLRPWLDLPALPPARLAAVLATWPGPNTWVMPAAADAPPTLEPLSLDLCRAFGVLPIAGDTHLAHQVAGGVDGARQAGGGQQGYGEHFHGQGRGDGHFAKHLADDFDFCHGSGLNAQAAHHGGDEHDARRAHVGD